MLRPTTLSRATQPLRQLATQSSPLTSTSVLPQNQALIQTRQKSTINKHRLPKKKFLALREALGQDVAPKQTKPAPVQNPAPRGPAPFVISRTASQNLPVYLECKRGGNKKLTLIRKLEGDRTVLAQWLAEDFGLEKKKVRVKAPTNHVELEGEYVEDVKKWLLARGF
ncbi:Mitochondrial large subunit ribosomal protein (Img2) domain containing protein [Naviculisporaceae sp. PSN 640]